MKKLKILKSMKRLKLMKSLSYMLPIPMKRFKEYPMDKYQVTKNLKKTEQWPPVVTFLEIYKNWKKW